MIFWGTCWKTFTQGTMTQTLKALNLDHWSNLQMVRLVVRLSSLSSCLSSDHITRLSGFSPSGQSRLMHPSQLCSSCFPPSSFLLSSTLTLLPCPAIQAQSCASDPCVGGLSQAFSHTVPFPRTFSSFQPYLVNIYAALRAQFSCYWLAPKHWAKGPPHVFSEPPMLPTIRGNHNAV